MALVIKHQEELSVSTVQNEISYKTNKSYFLLPQSIRNLPIQTYLLASQSTGQKRISSKNNTLV